MATGTKWWEIVPFARVFVGDPLAVKYTDDKVLEVLRVTNGILALMGYDTGAVSDPDGLSVTLSDKQMALFGKSAAVLLQDPEAMAAAVEAVSVRTLGTSYSTEGRARLMESSSSRAIASLRAMILSLSEPMRSTLDDLDTDNPSVL